MTRISFQLAHDTAANWTANNPTLLLGEKGYETDTKKWKTGDGTTAWASLGYESSGTTLPNLTVTGTTPANSATTGSTILSGGIGQNVTVTDPSAQSYGTFINSTASLSADNANSVGCIKAVAYYAGSKNMTGILSGGAFQALPSHPSGVVSYCYGAGSTFTLSGAGNVGLAVGHQVIVSKTAGTVDNAYGLNVNAINCGTTNNIGLNIQNISGGSNNFAIHTLAGPVYVGDTSASTNTLSGALQVQGGAGIVGAINAGGAIAGTSVNGITALASATSPMDGTAAVGTSTTVARQDHVHASDTSREAALGNPGVNGYVLSSTTGGTRSWIAAGGSAAWGSITGTLSSQTDLNSALTGKEPALGNPGTSGYVLSSTTGGVRSWVAQGGSASPSAINFTYTGGTTAQTLQNFMENMYVDVRSFGADPTGATDSSAAVLAAVNAAAASGIGRVYFGGKNAIYAFNLVLSNQSNITLCGSTSSGSRYTSSISMIKPWTIANPIIEIGNGTANIYGVTLQDLYFYGIGPNGTGQTGLLLSDGAQFVNTHRLTFKNFLGVAFKIGPTTTSYPIQYNNFYATDISAHTSVSSTACLGMYYGATGWTTANYFHGLNISGNSLVSHVIELDSTECCIYGGWIQATAAHGLNLLKSQASYPYLRGDCDFETGAGEAVHGFDTTSWSNFVRGHIRFSTGATLVDSGSTSHPMSVSYHIGSAEMYAPHALDYIYLNGSSQANPTATTVGVQFISGELDLFTNYTTANNLALQTDGKLVHTANGGVTMRIIATATATNYLDITSAATGGTVTIAANGSVDANTPLTINSKGTGLVTVNKVDITQPASTATLTLVGGSTLQTTGAFTLNLTTTVASTPTFPSGAGTLVYLGGTNTWSAAQTLSIKPVMTQGIQCTAYAGGTTAGQLWYDSTMLCHAGYADGIKTYHVGTIFTQTATGTNGANTAITNILGTGVGTNVLPVSWGVAGKTIRIKVGGTVTTAASPGTTVITIYLSAGTPVTLVASPSTTLTASMTNMPFYADIMLTWRSTTSVMASGVLHLPSATTGLGFTDIVLGTTTAATTVAATSYTVQVCATNGTASGTVYTTQTCSIEVVA